MKIKNFIENSGFSAEFYQGEMELSDIVLNIDSWKNNGKVEGWGSYNEVWIPVNDDCIEYKMISHKRTWQYYMYRMTQALIEGKNLEDYIKTL